VTDLALILSIHSILPTSDVSFILCVLQIIVILEKNVDSSFVRQKIREIHWTARSQKQETKRTRFKRFKKERECKLSSLECNRQKDQEDQVGLSLKETSKRDWTTSSASMREGVKDIHAHLLQTSESSSTTEMMKEGEFSSHHFVTLSSSTSNRGSSTLKRYVVDPSSSHTTSCRPLSSKMTSIEDTKRMILSCFNQNNPKLSEDDHNHHSSSPLSRKSPSYSSSIDHFGQPVTKSSSYFPSCTMSSVHQENLYRQYKDRRHQQLLSTTSCCLITILLSLLLSLDMVSSQNSCPSKCNCIWRNGKQTTICENQGFIAIPSGISIATQVLNLNANNFQTLPSRVFQERGLTNLQKVFLSKCKLGEMRKDALIQLTNLVELDLSYNLLTTVPSSSLEHTPGLRRLVLNNNPIATIPKDSFSHTPELNSLDISDCQIDSIEGGAFRGLSKLQYLFLQGNRLATLSLPVTQDLPVLYALDLHKNPWNCDCLLRPAREWMIRYNVPQSIPPTCSGPEKLSGMMWNSLQLDDFACSPVILSRDTDYSATVGSNISIQCITRAQPEARVSWSIKDNHGNNVSFVSPLKNERYSFNEDRSQSGLGIVSAILNITNVEESDGRKCFLCSAENSAGVASKPFSLSVFSTSGSSWTWTRVDLSIAIIATLLLIIVLCVATALYIVRSRRFKDSGSSTGSTAKASHHPIVHGSTSDTSSSSHKSNISGSIPQIDVLKYVPSNTTPSPMGPTGTGKEMLELNGQIIGYNNIVHPALNHHIHGFGQQVAGEQDIGHIHYHHQNASQEDIMMPHHHFNQHNQMMEQRPNHISHVNFVHQQSHASVIDYNGTTIDPVTGYPISYGGYGGPEGHQIIHHDQQQHPSGMFTTPSVSVVNGDPTMNGGLSVMYGTGGGMNGAIPALSSAVITSTASSTSSNNSINNVHHYHHHPSQQQQLNPETTAGSGSGEIPTDNNIPISGTCVICDQAFADLRFHYMDFHQIRECIV